MLTVRREVEVGKPSVENPARVADLAVAEQVDHGHIGHGALSLPVPWPLTRRAARQGSGLDLQVAPALSHRVAVPAEPALARVPIGREQAAQPVTQGFGQSRAAAAARAAAGSASAMRPTASSSCAADRNQASYGEGGR